MLAAFPEFSTRLETFLQDHGHRELDMDCAVPTWSDQPWVVLDTVALILRSDAEEEPAEMARKQRLHFATTEHHFLVGLPEELRFFFRELIRMARTCTALDDLEHYQTTRINPVAHHAALALGRRLQERGILDTPHDVFFFHKADLEELAAAYPNEPREAFREKMQLAKASFAAAQQASPPWSPAEVEASADSGPALRGLPGSPGRVRGACYCVREPADFGALPQGDHPGGPDDDPAWTPLFYGAAGLITESGGPLSHGAVTAREMRQRLQVATLRRCTAVAGAVTAREMRLPAVISVRNALSLFHDGQVVTVDGSQGLVVLEE